jgi:hypothetical protein
MRTQFCASFFGFVALSVCALDAQTIPQRVRANPDLSIVGYAQDDVRPIPLDRLSTESTLVLIGRLHSPRSYLSRDETAILTDYVIHPEQVIAGSLSVVRSGPGQSPTPILALSGGDLTIEGKRVSMVDRRMDRPMAGGRFLMFLQPFGDSGKYKATYGAIFELQNERIRGLLKMATGADPYIDITERTLPAVVPDIARARARR